MFLIGIKDGIRNGIKRGLKRGHKMALFSVLNEARQ